jgi:predicted Zn-dependent protease
MSGRRGPDDLRLLAERLVELARRAGADEVEVGVGEGTEFNVDVRLGRVENLFEAGSRVLGLRVVKDKRTATAARRTSVGKRSAACPQRRPAGGPSRTVRRLAPLVHVDLNAQPPDPEIRTLDAATRSGWPSRRAGRARTSGSQTHTARAVTNEAWTMLAN